MVQQDESTDLSGRSSPTVEQSDVELAPTGDDTTADLSTDDQDKRRCCERRRFESGDANGGQTALLGIMYNLGCLSAFLLVSGSVAWMAFSGNSPRLELPEADRDWENSTNVTNATIVLTAEFCKALDDPLPSDHIWCACSGETPFSQDAYFDPKVAYLTVVGVLLGTVFSSLIIQLLYRLSVKRCGCTTDIADAVVDAQEVSMDVVNEQAGEKESTEVMDEGVRAFFFLNTTALAYISFFYYFLSAPSAVWEDPLPCMLVYTTSVFVVRTIVKAIFTPPRHSLLLLVAAACA